MSLNSMADQVRSAPSMSRQVKWLKEDLDKTDKSCLLAFWHQPLFSSGEHGHDPTDAGRKMGRLWTTLADHQGDVIVNGHDHDYERFGLQNAKGIADPNQGIREFVVGTGGARLRPFEGLQPNHEANLDDDATDHGVLFLKLGSGSYEWTFVRTDGTVGDRSREPQPCHPKSRAR